MSLVPILLIAIIPKGNFLAGFATVFFYCGPLLLIEIVISLLGYYLPNKTIKKFLVIILVLLTFLQYWIMVMYHKEIT